MFRAETPASIFACTETPFSAASSHSTDTCASPGITAGGVTVTYIAYGPALPCTNTLAVPT